ncbi:50S ribosomal protein L18 [Hibiscus syriacus]|uniref:50S ribosomal protein L18 n=1 Tax=Hibiscus syriacus TaxID=106335 RepID=A0A6A3ARX2_HIBSY|nr:50S ribosomal protein L18 [Hibiscus syriacus]
MAVANFPALKFKTCDIFGRCFKFPPLQNRSHSVKTLVVEAKANTRTESAKIRNRRMLKKFNGTPRRPRLSVFCSEKQLYAMLMDDKTRSVYSMEARCRSRFATILLAPPLKLLNVLVKSW